MARPHSTATSPTRSAPPPASEPGTLVRLRAAAAAVGVDEEELKRRAQAAGVKIHTVVRAGEAQAALDLDDVWRLRSDGAVVEREAEHPVGLELSRVTSRLEREAEESRERHAEAVQRALKLEDALRSGEQALRVEKSRQAELEAQLSESARTLAETQRALMELRASNAAREREFKTQLEEERRTAAGMAQAVEAARQQAAAAVSARAEVEKRLAESVAAQTGLADELAGARKDHERLSKELGEVKTLRARLAETEALLAKSNAALARAEADAKSAREQAEARAAELARAGQESKRLAEAERTLAANLQRAEQGLEAAKAQHALELSRRLADEAKQRATLEERVQAAQAALAKSETARGIFERELAGARAELDGLEESCARATLERDRLKQRAETLASQLATASEGEKALQRYADRKEAELAALRREVQQ